MKTKSTTAFGAISDNQKITIFLNSILFASKYQVKGNIFEISTVKMVRVNFKALLYTSGAASAVFCELNSEL